MNKDLHSLLQTTAVIAGLALSGCSSDNTGATSGAVASDAGCPAKDSGCPAVDAGCPGKEAGCPAETPKNPGTADLPPTGLDADVTAWLARGDYKTGTWKCESAPHAARSPSPHGINRICSNKTLSEHGAGEFPIGAAGVKELYDGAGAQIVGYAVYRKMKAGGGEAWYWWEQMGGSTVANGLGDTGVAKSVCVGCHAGAGSDSAHSGHDQVYTQVK